MLWEEIVSYVWATSWKMKADVIYNRLGKIIISARFVLNLPDAY